MALETIPSGTDPGDTPVERSVKAPSSPRHPSTPVVLWALAGALSLGVIFSGWIRWMASSDFRSSPKGPSSFSTAHLVFLNIFQYAVFALGVLMVWRYLVRPWRAQRRLTFDGMMMIAVLTMYFYDVVDNFFRSSFAYNAYFVNFGGWTSFVPGFQLSSRSQTTEPFIVMLGFYAIFMFGSAVFGCWFVRRVQARYGRISTLSCFVALFSTVAVIDFIVENVFMRTQFAAYTGGLRGLTLFAGHYYQFPVYEVFIIALFAVGMTSIRFFRDGEGRSLAERGIAALALSPRVERPVRFLAITGMVQLWFIVGYFVPYNFFALISNVFPAYPSFLR